MKRSRRALIGLLSMPLLLLGLGFVVFAATVLDEPVNEDVRADGIVVLTGGPIRITEGARLLRAGRAKRLLISGVNRQAKRESLLRISGLDRGTFECCVDLGYAALDTVGNADETRSWAEKNGYSRLVIVTSNYHMPRSMVELARALPEVELIPHAVPHRRNGAGVWWRDPRLALDLAREYLKFLPAAARLMASRVAMSSVATMSADEQAKS